MRKSSEVEAPGCRLGHLRQLLSAHRHIRGGRWPCLPSGDGPLSSPSNSLAGEGWETDAGGSRPGRGRGTNGLAPQEWGRGSQLPQRSRPLIPLFFPSPLRPALLSSASLLTWQPISHSFPPFRLVTRVTPYVPLISAGFPGCLAPRRAPAPGTWGRNRANEVPLL